MKKVANPKPMPPAMSGSVGGLPEILPPIYDIVFKLVFVNRPDLLGPFLKSVIGLPDSEFWEIVVVDPHVYPEHVDEKLGVLDIKVVLKSKKAIDVEMQQKKLTHLRERVLFYCSGMVREQIAEGGDYENIKPVISITVTKHEVISGDAAYHHRFTLYDPETGVEFTDLLEVHILELPKLPKVDDGSDLWWWMKFLTVETRKELAMIAEKSPVLEKAADHLLRVSEDMHTRHRMESVRLYEMDQRIMMREASAKAREEGLQEGRQESIRQVTGIMKAAGVSIDLIAEYTGLSVDEILQL